MNRLATTTWFSSPMSFESISKIAAASGYHTVAIAATRETLRHDPSELLKILAGSSLEISSLSIGVPLLNDPANLNLHSSSSEIRLHSVNYVRECIDYASQVGARFVYVCSIRKEEDLSLKDANGLFTDSLTRCAEYGQRLGVSVALEPFPLGYFRCVKNAQELVQQIGGVGIVFDIGHEALCGLPLDLPVDPSLIFDVHLNNNDGINDRHWPLENGVLRPEHYSSLFKHLHSIGYREGYTIELASAGENGSELSRARTYLESFGMDFAQPATQRLARSEHS
jgi:sugar phosphate isomerase/epimerase